MSKIVENTKHYKTIHNPTTRFLEFRSGDEVSEQEHVQSAESDENFIDPRHSVQYWIFKRFCCSDVDQVEHIEQSQDNKLENVEILRHVESKDAEYNSSLHKYQVVNQSELRVSFYRLI
jgi:hypothetical protein